MIKVTCVGVTHGGLSNFVGIVWLNPYLIRGVTPPDTRPLDFKFWGYTPTDEQQKIVEGHRSKTKADIRYLYSDNMVTLWVEEAPEQIAAMVEHAMRPIQIIRHDPNYNP